MSQTTQMTLPTDMHTDAYIVQLICFCTGMFSSVDLSEETTWKLFEGIHFETAPT